MKGILAIPILGPLITVLVMTPVIQDILNAVFVVVLVTFVVVLAWFGWYATSSFDPADWSAKVAARRRDRRQQRIKELV